MAYPVDQDQFITALRQRLGAGVSPSPSPFPSPSPNEPMLSPIESAESAAISERSDALRKFGQTGLPQKKIGFSSDITGQNQTKEGEQAKISSVEPYSPEVQKKMLEIYLQNPMNTEALSQHQNLKKMLQDRMQAPKRFDTRMDLTYPNKMVDIWANRLGATSNLAEGYKAPVRDTTTKEDEAIELQTKLADSSRKLATDVNKSMLDTLVNKAVVSKDQETVNLLKSIFGIKTEEGTPPPKTGGGTKLASARQFFNDFDAYIKEDKKGISAADQALAGLATGTLAGQDLAKTGIARQAGESGVLTEKDISRVAFNPALKARILTAWNKWAVGSPLPADQEVAKLLIMGYKAQQLKRIDDAANLFVNERSSGYQVDRNTIGNALRAEYLKPHEAVEQKDTRKEAVDKAISEGIGALKDLIKGSKK